MADNILQTAHNPDAPDNERLDALAQAQKQFMPSSVPDLSELVSHIARAQQDAEFYQSLSLQKSLQSRTAVPYPSKAVQEGQTRGMQSVYIDDRQLEIVGDWYEKPSNFNFLSMRHMVDRTPLLSAIIMTRIRQVARFCRANSTGTGPGFTVKPKRHMGKQTQKMRDDIQLLNGFFSNCGWENNPRERQRLGRDSFSGLMGKLVRDSLVMDSAPIECEYKRNRRLGMDGFYAVDGSTIRLCSEEGYKGDNEIFALQVVQGNIRTAYTFDDLIYVPRNPRTDILQGGYGMSECELLVTTVTGFLNAMTYNQKFFDSNAIPHGILHLAGDYNQDDLASFKRYWNSMVRGINNAWSLPVLTSKNGESKASFEKFGTEIQDVQFAKWMTFLTAITCAIYGMAPEEINFESFTSGASRLSGNNTEEKIIHSKDKGLRPLLSHFEDLFSDYIVSDFDNQYEFAFVGLDDKPFDQAFKEETTTLTLNEMRQLRGHAPVPGDWGNAPLNPTVQQAWANAKSQQAAAEPQPAEEEPETPMAKAMKRYGLDWMDWQKPRQ